MREIKFRAKTENVNEIENHNSYWVYGLLENSYDEDYPYYIKGCFIKPETIGQFTGLLDKNGKEIYEGDICRRILNKDKRFDFPDDYSDYWLIEWLNPTAGFTTTLIGDFCNGKLVRKPFRQNSFSQRLNEMEEVIGNIHENPNLVKNYV